MKKRLTVYMVARTTTNWQIMKRLSLRESLARLVFVTDSRRRGVLPNVETLLINSYPNPTGVLKIIGLPKLKDFLDRHLCFPSPAILYVKAAKRKLARKIGRELQKSSKVCVITSVPRFDLGLLGLYLKRKFPSIYWVVDWQDLWSYDEYYFNRVPRYMRNRVKRLESEILNTCDMNVVTNIYAKEILQEHYNVPADKAIAINHAFDPSAKQEILVPVDVSMRRSPNDPIKIGFLGNLFKPPKVPGKRVLEALEGVRAQGVDLVFHVYGGENKAACEATKGRDWAILHPRTSHDESLKRIAECDFLLLALSDLPNCHVILPGKLPHYLTLGKPILALVPDASIVATIVRETGTGYVISPSKGWEIGLAKVLSEYRTKGVTLKRNEEEINQYSWENISKQWLAVIARASNVENV